MARLDLNTIKKIDKERNTVNTPVTATYTVFDLMKANVMYRLIPIVEMTE